jgi:hypothetical protein
MVGLLMAGSLDSICDQSMIRKIGDRFSAKIMLKQVSRAR